MAWLFAVKGVCFTTPSNDPDLLEESILSNPRWKELKSWAAEKDLVFAVRPNDDELFFSAFVGQDLLPSRHIYNGQTHTCSDEVSERTWDDIRNLAEELGKILAERDEKFTKFEGLILSQFD